MILYTDITNGLLNFNLYEDIRHPTIYIVRKSQVQSVHKIASSHPIMNLKPHCYDAVTRK